MSRWGKWRPRSIFLAALAVFFTRRQCMVMGRRRGPILEMVQLATDSFFREQVRPI